MEIRILCLTTNDAVFEALGRRYGVRIDAVPAVSELIEVLIAEPYNGIILETRQMIRAGGHEKRVLQEWIDAFPVLRVNVAPGSGGVKSLTDMDHFFQITCKEFVPRSVRSDRRVTVNLPVQVGRADDPHLERGEKTHSLNLSEKGLFIYSNSSWIGEEWAWVRFLDLPDDTPALLRVGWFRPWGAGLYLSGLGGVFARIHPEQYTTLCSRFLLKSRCNLPDTSAYQDELDAFLASLG